MDVLRRTNYIRQIALVYPEHLQYYRMYPKIIPFLICPPGQSSMKLVIAGARQSDASLIVYLHKIGSDGQDNLEPLM